MDSLSGSGRQMYMQKTYFSVTSSVVKPVPTLLKLNFDLRVEKSAANCCNCDKSCIVILCNDTK
jgi:hypothetical protein